MLKFRIFNLLLLFPLFIFTASFAADLSDENRWLLDEAKKVNKIYVKAYIDQPWQFIERYINNKLYRVERPNHGLPHALRKALLMRAIVNELKKAPAANNPLAQWIQSFPPEELAKQMKKLLLAALYQRIGRESEINRRTASAEDKARFDQNMQNGALVFKKAAQESGLFKDDEEIQRYMDSYMRDAIKDRGDYNRIFTGETKFIDELLHTIHILDSRRVNQDWNDIAKKPEIKDERIRSLGHSLGFNKDLAPVERLNDLSEKYLEITGDKDKFKGKTTYSDIFFILSHDPDLLFEKLIAVSPD